EQRYDGYVALEGRGELDPDVVTGQIDLAPPLFVGRIQPTRPDDRKDHVAFCYLFIELFREIETRLHGVNVHEYLAARESVSQPIEQASGHPERIVPAVIYEYCGHGYRQQ